MRSFRLTKKGKGQVKIVSRERDDLLDYLYPNKVSTLDELKSLFGSEVRITLSQLEKKGLVEELREDGLS